MGRGRSTKVVTYYSSSDDELEEVEEEEYVSDADYIPSKKSKAKQVQDDDDGSKYLLMACGIAKGQAGEKMGRLNMTEQEKTLVFREALLGQYNAYSLPEPDQLLSLATRLGLPLDNKDYDTTHAILQKLLNWIYSNVNDKMTGDRILLLNDSDRGKTVVVSEALLNVVLSDDFTFKVLKDKPKLKKLLSVHEDDYVELSSRNELGKAMLLKQTMNDLVTYHRNKSTSSSNKAKARKGAEMLPQHARRSRAPLLPASPVMVKPRQAKKAPFSGNVVSGPPQLHDSLSESDGESPSEGEEESEDEQPMSPTPMPARVSKTGKRQFKLSNAPSQKPSKIVQAGSPPAQQVVRKSVVANKPPKLVIERTSPLGPARSGAIEETKTASSGPSSKSAAKEALLSRPTSISKFSLLPGKVRKGKKTVVTEDDEIDFEVARLVGTLGDHYSELQLRDMVLQRRKAATSTERQVGILIKNEAHDAHAEHMVVEALEEEEGHSEEDEQDDEQDEGEEEDAESEEEGEEEIQEEDEADAASDSQMHAGTTSSSTIAAASSAAAAVDPQQAMIKALEDQLAEMKLRLLQAQSPSPATPAPVGPAPTVDHSAMSIKKGKKVKAKVKTTGIPVSISPPATAVPSIVDSVVGSKKLKKIKANGNSETLPMTPPATPAPSVAGAAMRLKKTKATAKARKMAVELV